MKDATSKCTLIRRSYEVKILISLRGLNMNFWYIAYNLNMKIIELRQGILI